MKISTRSLVLLFACLMMLTMMSSTVHAQPGGEDQVEAPNDGDKEQDDGKEDKNQDKEDKNQGEEEEPEEPEEEEPEEEAEPTEEQVVEDDIICSDFLDDCVACLAQDNDCVWTAGRCDAVCIADADCWELDMPGVDNDATAADICDMAAMEELSGFDDNNATEAIVPMPEDLCAEATDCTTCLETDPGDANEDDPMFGEEPCVWTAGSCMRGCQLMDVACWSVDEETPIEATCTRAANEELDAETCASMDNCTACIETPILTGLDANATCQWVEWEGGTGFCQHQCGMMGCGITDECPMMNETDIVMVMNETEMVLPACVDVTTCTDCLGLGCAYSPQAGCMLSCDMIADASCYETGVEGQIDVICAAAADEEDDAPTQADMSVSEETETTPATTEETTEAPEETTTEPPAMEEDTNADVSKQVPTSGAPTTSFQAIVVSFVAIVGVGMMVV